MSKWTVRRGENFRIDESDEQSTAVPYPAVALDDRINHGFVDLRAHPELIDQIPEAQTSPAMREVLRVANAERSSLMTIGCQYYWVSRDAKDALGEPTCYVAAYIALTFWDRRANEFADRLRSLAIEISTRLPSAGGPPIVFYELTVEPLKAFYDREGGYEVILEPQGFGNSMEEAGAAFEVAAKGLADALEHLPP